MHHQRRTAVLVLVVDGGEELEMVVVVVEDRQVEEDVLLAVELVMEVRRLEELGPAGAAGDVEGGEGVRGRNRCILQHKSELVDPSSGRSCAQDCHSKRAAPG